MAKKIYKLFYVKNIFVEKNVFKILSFLNDEMPSRFGKYS